MRFFRLTLLVLASILVLVGVNSCSKSEGPKGPDAPETLDDYHFDLWVALDRHGGMGRDVQTLVRSLDNLEAGQPQITFVGVGTEVNSVMSMETIIKDGYYYQVPVSADRFSKYMIKDNKITVIAERRFQTNTFSCRKYTHAWLDDNTLLIMAASGDNKSIIWTKLNTTSMSIVSEGTLDIPLPDKSNVFTTSGILAFRRADNTLFYFYYGKGKIAGGKNTRTSPFFTAVINPSTMAVVSNTPCSIDCEPTGSAYGELLQKIVFFTENSDLYLACYADTPEGEKSYLLKMPANTTTFDATYNGFPGTGKLISVEYLGNDKLIAYARDDSKGTGLDAFSHYYTIINVKTKVSTPLSYNGQRLDYCSGRFSSRMAVVNNKAYVGIDPQGSNPKIYIYDSESNEVTKGAEMASGYYFEHIRVVENAK